ncbi:hypothetical protein B0G81_0252 [Paraburkholderia sp. BL6665CI2N2]|nr:hypothetical protein B0G73_111157 [Paraburkholderia sp. BL25I1N1]TDY20101.1 hypothetical protein B0G81_0252 [Paraburkholderia sp. BL6665CI2N2]
MPAICGTCGHAIYQNTAAPLDFLNRPTHEPHAEAKKPSARIASVAMILRAQGRCFEYLMGMANDQQSTPLY